MATITRSTLVPYSTKQMFDLVNDIENYPEFLPWCPLAKVDKVHTDGLEATVHFEKGPIKHAFTTRNQLEPGRSVKMTLVKGPFRFLEGCWLFEETPEGSKIAFELHFEWSHSLLNMAIGPFFNQIATTLIDAFTQRAKIVYAND
jgi:ribosome-associated toxin RatA of RatAB toxin-antitoxin module